MGGYGKEFLDATTSPPSSARLTTAAPIPPLDETGGMDREMVGVVEDSPAAFISHRLGLWELTDDDLGSIIRCANSLEYKEEMEKILKDIQDGLKAVFRLSPGLMILEIVKRGKDKELFVYWLEGKNMFRQLRHVKKAVETMAAANGCNLLGAVVHDERWARKLLKTFGGTVNYSLSVEL